MKEIELANKFLKNVIKRREQKQLDKVREREKKLREQLKKNKENKKKAADNVRAKARKSPSKKQVIPDKGKSVKKVELKTNDSKIPV